MTDRCTSRSSTKAHININTINCVRPLWALTMPHSKYHAVSPVPSHSRLSVDSESILVLGVLRYFGSVERHWNPLILALLLFEVYSLVLIHHRKGTSCPLPFTFMPSVPPLVPSTVHYLPRVDLLPPPSPRWGALAPTPGKALYFDIFHFRVKWYTHPYFSKT